MPFIKIVVLVWNVVYEYLIDLQMCQMHAAILGQL